METTLIFFVNGKKVVELNPDPEETLLNFIRRRLCLTGTKLGCAEGGCGACTVMVSRYDRHSTNVRHYSINACLAPLCSMHGLAVTTVEGIGSTRTRLHRIQECLAKSHGSQCGFCTPGFIMSMYTLIRNKPCPMESDIESTLQGNLCRCTGYRPILEGFKLVASHSGSCQMMTDGSCCRRQISSKTCCQGRVSENGISCMESREQGDDVHEKMSEEQLSSYKETLPQYTQCDPTQELIFPSELQLKAEQYETSRLKFQSKRRTWYRPTSLADLLWLKQQHPNATLIVGNTEIGIETKFKNMHHPVILAATHVPELNAIEFQNKGLRFGASVSLTTVNETFKKAMNVFSEDKTRIFAAVVEMLRWFAGNQIRNTAAVGGNIMTASPISDLNPLLQAAGCTLTLASHADGRRTVQMDENFFTGYRRTSIKAHEILLYVDVPFTTEDVYFESFKQAQRRDDDIAIVNAGMKVRLHEEQLTVKDLVLSFGGMASTTIMASKTSEQLIGRQWNDDLLPIAYKYLLEELQLPVGAPGGMEAYRCTLALSFFFKFYVSVRLQLEAKTPRLFSTKMADSCHSSAAKRYFRPSSTGVQVYEIIGDDQLMVDAVGRPLPHLSGQKHTTGEAVFVDDIPEYRDELNLALVVSSESHADILNIDISDALALPGVVTFVDHRDIPGKNNYGVCAKDDEIFATSVVSCQGQVVGAIVAETKFQAQTAAKAVRISYKKRTPLVITILEAIEADSYFGTPQSINKGDVQAALNVSDYVLEGRVHIGGQEHFYLETQSCIAVPKGEDGEMEIYSSTQSINMLQNTVAEALNVDCNKIVVRTKRLGGGFGGKESRSVMLAGPVAIAARKCNRPVRAMLDRDEDMATTGARHAFLGIYKVGFTKDGKITALHVDMYSNAGNTLDHSKEIMMRAIFHCENCYAIPNVSVTGYCCKTNIPSCTAMRGFGAPQAIFITESIITHIASHLQMSDLQVREINIYNEGDLTHYNQPLTNSTIRRCWDLVIANSDYETRRTNVRKFNRENRWKKRGLCVLPSKHGISFGHSYLHQAGALVHIYMDGSVLIAHGGVEMGQGLHTKMIQIASRVLQIPTTFIHICETTNTTVPNATDTAASLSSDLNGMAVLNACQTLLDRLAPYREISPNAKWKQWVKSAYDNCVSLSATGFYKFTPLTYSFEENCGEMYKYFTNGAACSEVEIDCLTGDHTVLRTDIVMDVGKSLNPAIDIGQIEGAFVQGYGLYTIEELKFSPSGYLLSRGPGTYKIPSCSNIPIDFNVVLLKDSTNPNAVYSSKGIGEPPLALATSVFFAIKDAISSARADAGVIGPFTLDGPATAERIRMACADDLTKQVPEYKTGTFVPWNVRL